MYLILRFLIVDIYTIIVTTKGNFCALYDSTHLTQRCTLFISGYNLKNSADSGYLNIIDILNLVLTIVSMVYFSIYRRITYKLQNWLDYNDISQEDYSVLVENIPVLSHDLSGADCKIEMELKQKIEYKIREWFPVLGMYLN